MCTQLTHSVKMALQRIKRDIQVAGVCPRASTIVGIRYLPPHSPFSVCFPLGCHLKVCIHTWTQLSKNNSEFRSLRVGLEHQKTIQSHFWRIPWFSIQNSIASKQVELKSKPQAMLSKLWLSKTRLMNSASLQTVYLPTQVQVNHLYDFYYI